MKNKSGFIVPFGADAFSARDWRNVWMSTNPDCEHFEGCPHWELLLGAKHALALVLRENQKLGKIISMENDLMKQKRNLLARIRPAYSRRL